MSWHPSNFYDTFENQSDPFIPKVSQKLDYCFSTHTRALFQPRRVPESTESVYFTKAKTEFHANLIAQQKALDYPNTHTLTHTHTHTESSWHLFNF